MTHSRLLNFICSVVLGVTIALGGQTLLWAQQPIHWDQALDQSPDWYAGSEAIRIAENLRVYQTEYGGWPKNIDMARELTDADRAEIRNEQAIQGTELSYSTIDNGATLTQLRFLARVYEATGHEPYAESFYRGLDYLMDAQYASGGWPQYYPIREGYYENITLNDNAMVGVLEILRAIAEAREPFTFLREEYQAETAARVQKGIANLLQMQIVQHGVPTAWCAQYDPESLEPAWARAYEPPSISGAESVGVVRFLMTIENPSPEIVAAIDGAVEWFRSVAIYGYRYETFTDENGNRDRRVVMDPDAGPIWARFYELETNRPIFLGRDSVVRYALSEIEQERRAGYSYYGTWAASLLAEEYPQWKLSLERRATVDSILQSQVEERRITGGTALVMKSGEVIYEGAFGWADREAGERMQMDHIFRIASQTKAITSAAVLILVDEGIIHPNDQVSKWLPSFASTTVYEEGEIVPAKREITIRDLLTHTSGISYGGNEQTMPLYHERGLGGPDAYAWYTAHKDEEICETMDRLGEVPFVRQPGEAWVYGYSTDILGCVVERAGGMPLDRFFEERITGPLGMTDTHFFLPVEKSGRLAAVYTRDEEGVVHRAVDGARGQGHYDHGPQRNFSGGAGLLSTAKDYAVFLEMTRNGGLYEGRRILSPESAALMKSNLVGSLFRGGLGFGFGFQTTDRDGANGLASTGTYGWSGAYGTDYEVDPQRETVLVLMIQVVPYYGPGIREEFKEAVYRHLVPYEQ
ncbi:MAG: pectate lyase [Balneolaceae bacterium]